jgi:hypothetical protein
VNRVNQLPDHPEPTPHPTRDAPVLASDEEASPRVARPEPSVPPFGDAERQALEGKNITIDVMILYKLSTHPTLVESSRPTQR